MTDAASDETHIPDAGAVDDTDTVEGQLTTASGPPHLPRHLFYQLRRHLSDVHYPASQAELYGYAKKNGADQETLGVLGRLQQASYNTFSEVSNEVSRTL